jgi:hypothetical protein
MHWGRTVHRGPTMIALRARREANQIARDVAFPHVEVAPPQQPVYPGKVWIREDIEYHNAMGRPFFVEEPELPAPAWFKWLVFASLTATAIGGILIFKYVD